MPLNKLDNFIKNTEGRILYVSPSDLDSTDSISNEGNSLARPFKTVQRALLEAARFSYVKGRSNDEIAKTTIVLYPGEHIIDNRPGYRIYNEGGVAKVQPAGGGTVSNALTTLDLNLTSNFDLTQEDNILYKFNSVYGGIILPRGTSIVGMDLRKTRIRPKYVPNPTDPSVGESAIFRMTGTCYLWQFSLFDGDDLGLVYTDPANFSKTASPIFSHHKLSCFEYADGVNYVTLGNTTYDITDLDMYYAKIGNAYNVGSGREIENTQKYPTDPLAFWPQRPEFEIVGAFAADPITLTSIRAGDEAGVTNVVTAKTSRAHGYQVGTPIKVRGVTPTNYNISATVTGVSNTDDTIFTYTLPNPPLTLIPGNTSAATVTVETDTVQGASPYVFNCSMRSVYGMNGMNIDGAKATGFRSIVVAQFTGISLQKDDRAFVKYNPVARSYDGISLGSPTEGAALAAESSATATGEAYHLDSSAIYRRGWETAHIKLTNDAVAQVVSVFAIGFANHFLTESGADQSITNSNSNFGQLSLVSDGFKKDAFQKDNKAFLTSIIPPRKIETTSKDLDWLAIDKAKTLAVADNAKLFLDGYTSADILPPVNTQGFKVGAKVGDILYLLAGGVERTAQILMPDGSSSAKEYRVTGVDELLDTFTIGNNTLDTGEKVVITSDDGDLPENVSNTELYYAVRAGSTKIQLASSEADAISGKIIDIAGGTNLRIFSRVSDKLSGDLGHPVQFDATEGQWYVNTNNTSGSGGIYHALNTAGLIPEDVTTATYIKRIDDTRSLDEKVYKIRVVIPKELQNAKNPENGFVIQESSSTGARSDADFTFNNTLTGDDYEFEKNPRFIATCTSASSTGICSIRSELPHNLNVNDTVIIKNVTDSVNVTGTANTGYNGTYKVLTVHNSMEFAYQPVTVHGLQSTNDTSIRTVSLPRFEKNNLQTNLYIYRALKISNYIQDKQDGVYHIYALSSDHKIDSEFTDYGYSQNVSDLYPQLDRDNPDDNPPASKSYALRSPIGDVSTNDLKKSLTRESTDSFIKALGVGVTVLTAPTGANPTITFSRSHGYAGIVTGSVTNQGNSYADGTYYNIKLLNSSISGPWRGATARVSIASSQITNVDIQSKGAGYSAGNLYFDPTFIGGDGTARYTITNAGITSAVGNVAQFTGIGVTEDQYLRITDVPNDTQITVAKVASGPELQAGQYVFNTGRAVEINSTTFDVTSGITTFACENSHGLAAGNSFSIVDGSNNELGSYVVNSAVGVTTFNAKTVSSVGSPAYAFKHGLSSNEKLSDKSNENISARTMPILDSENATTIDSIPSSGITTVAVQGVDNIIDRFPYGSYLQINSEIMRVASKTIVGSDQLQVIRGVFSTGIQTHSAGSVIRKIKPIPVEFRRPSILRASGHTFEYLGYGPGNYSTALPQVQDRTLTEKEEFLVQSQEKSGGVVVYTGMNNKGDFYIGNQKKSSATGEETTFDTPIPTVTGETPARLSAVFDEVTVKERIVVEGGDSGDILSSFDGPTTFNKSVKINNTLKVTGQTQLVSTLDTTSKESGSLVVAGGVGIASNLFVAGNNVAISTVTGAIIVENGGVGIAKSLHVGEGGYFAGIVSATSYYGDGTNLTGVEMPGGSIGTVFYDGNFVGFGASTGTPDMQIGHDSAHSIIRETGTGDLYLQSDGKVIISNTTASKVSIYCDTDDSVIINHNNDVRMTTYSGGVEFGDQTSNGNIRAYGDITAYYTSDASLKDNVNTIADPLEKVMQISGNTFTWKENDAGHEGEDTGVIAQEIEALGLPGIVVTRDNGKKAVKYEKLVPLLIEAIKELNAKVERLAATPDIMSAVGMINDIEQDKNQLMEERLERQNQSKKDTGNPNQGPVGWSEPIPPEDGI